MSLRRTVAGLVAAATVAGCAGGRPEVAPPPSAADGAPDAPPTAPAVQVRLKLSTASPRVGDTVRVEAVAVGPDGESLPGVAIEVRAPRRVLAVIDAGKALVALREGWGVVTARASPGRGESLDSVGVRIIPAALVRLALDAPSSMYAGTRARASVIAETAFGTRARSPEIAWRTSDPAVLRVTPTGGLHAVAPGRARVEATTEGERAAVDVRVIENPVRRVELSPGSADVTVGEVVHLTPRTYDAADREVVDVPIEWAVGAAGTAVGSAEVSPDGAFVANRPGSYLVTAVVGRHAGTSLIRASSRTRVGEARVVAHRGVADGAAGVNDVRVFEGVDGRDHAFAGTHGASTLHVWDVTDPASPRLAASVALPGGQVSDVEVDEEATLAVVGSEGAQDRRGGIALLDILDPGQPRVVTYFTENLAGGVLDAWIDGTIVYVAHEGDGALHVLDVSDPASPRHVARWSLESAGQSLHGVFVKDGFAYLGYGYDGLVILDVGAGIAGGTPADPRLVSRFAGAPRSGDAPPPAVRRAVRYRDWVFVAEERSACESCPDGSRGDVRVLDVTDIGTPRVVARYEVPAGSAHDLWAEDDLLYVAAGEGGARVLDVSGELRGDLGTQGREIARFATGAPDGTVPNVPVASAARPFSGRLYVGDLNSGLWILEIEREGE